MGIDYTGQLVFGVDLGLGEDMWEKFYNFMEKRGKISISDLFGRDVPVDEADLYQLKEGVNEILKDSPFEVGFVNPYDSDGYTYCRFYLTCKEFEGGLFRNELPLEKALSILQSFETTLKKQYEDILSDFGIAEVKPPNVFALPHAF